MMVGWSFAEMKQVLESFVPPGDPADPKERRRRQIVEAARQLFIQHGYRKTSIDDVARRARVAKGTVYVYFKNKADLLVQVIVDEKRQLLERLRPVIDQEQSPRERLRWWLRTALTVHEQLPLIGRLMRGDQEVLTLFEEMDPEIRERTVALHQMMIGGLLEQAAHPHRWTPSELEDRVKVLVGLMYASGAFADERVRGGLSVDRFAEVLTETLLGGLLPPDKRGER